MNAIKRLFKKKIRGEPLEKLAGAFNVDLVKDFKEYKSGWLIHDIFAKLNIVPQSNSLKLEAYFQSKQVEYPYYPDHKNPQYREGICFEKSIEIPYSELNKFNEVQK